MSALKPHVEGRRILRAATFVDRLRTKLTLAGNPALIGHRVLSLYRRAKYILAELDNSHALVLHLGMTGSCRIESPDTPLRPHDRVEFELDDGRLWRFHDPRRFGRVEVHAIPHPGALPGCLPVLAPEPLTPEFSVAWLRDACHGRQRPIKTLIMDNALVVGVGNIYASESLFRAGIRPQVPAAGLSARRVARLHGAIRNVLTEAIEYGGTTIINFAGVDGSEGRFRRRLDVYDRAGERCRRCRRGWIRRIIMAGRSTYFCPVCQR